MNAEPTAAKRAWTLTLEAPHRFFFLAGMGGIVTVSLWWAWVLAARAALLPPPAAAWPDTAAHALAMLCGFAPLFMFGFLFTAGPRWLAVAPPPRAAWLVAGLAIALGAPGLTVMQAAGSPLGVRAAAALGALGWTGLVVVFLRLIRASDARDRAHSMVLALTLAVGASTLAAFALRGVDAHRWVRGAGVWGFLLPTFAVVCHRMIPFFTANVVPQVRAFRPGWLLAALAGAPVLHGVVASVGFASATWIVDLPAAALFFWLAWRWGIAHSLGNRLLAMLHIGFLWYPVGFLLAGIDAVAAALGEPGPGLAALHAFTIGFAASLLLAMVTRVTRGHAGLPLVADGATWSLFLLLQAAAIARVVAQWLPGGAGLLVAVALWCAAFVPWALRCAPWCWRPRVDGRPG